MQIDQEEREHEDIGVAAREGRRPRDHGPYKVMIGDASLDFQPVTIRDATPTGRQLLDESGHRPADEHIIFAVLSDGLLDEIPLGESTDLRERGIERFIAFRSDRSFRFLLDGRQVEWGARRISGRTLLALAQADPDKYRVWQQVRGGDDKPIGLKDLVDLDEPGVERFFTGQASSTEGSAAFLPLRCRRYLEERGISYDEVDDCGQRGVVLRDVALPAGLFAAAAADILIILPAGYPDVTPDMFYAQPWLTVAATGRYPNCADQPLSFAGRNWQRWSRHNNQWRPGVDGIWTMIKRVQTALEKAA